MKNYFSNIFSFFVLFFLLSSITSSAFAQYKKDTKQKYNLDPEIGLWVGPSLPLGILSKKIGTNIGVGFFTRMNFPTNYLRFDFGISYAGLKKEGRNEKLTMVPIYAGLIYTLPIKFAMKFFLKFDIGTTFVKVMPENKKGWLPNFVLGVEGAFPTGRSVFVGLHIDYILVLDTYKKAPYENYKRTHGHFMNFGASVSYKFGQ